MNLQNGPLDKGLVALMAPLVVLPPWIWLAVRTQHCLQVITAHSVPFSKRTIWLVKALAVFVGAGGLDWGSDPSWYAMALCCFAGGDRRIYCAQGKRARSRATHA